MRNPSAPPSSKPELPVVLVKWYDYAKWVLERVEGFPKSQRFVLGQLPECQPACDWQHISGEIG